MDATASSATANSSSSFPASSSFVILSVSIVGILATSLLLLAYYLFLTRCECGLLLFWRNSLQDAIVAATVQQQQQPEPVPRRGLEEAAIRRIPTFRYRRDDGKCQRQAKASECAVCLADFRDGERLRLLPPCLHAFHIDCIDAWLLATANCPLCRTAVSASDDGTVVIDVDISEDTAAVHHPDQSAQLDKSCSSSSVPMRRSLSMDSCSDKRFYLALHSILQQQRQQLGSPALREEDGGTGKGESSTGAAGRSVRLRRSFFSFSHSRGSGHSPTAILPLFHDSTPPY